MAGAVLPAAAVVVVSKPDKLLETEGIFLRSSANCKMENTKNRVS
jgi:hypothetical protein